MSTTALSSIHESVPYQSLLPSERTAQPLISIEELRAQGTEFIRIQWVDLINNIRYRVLPLEYFEKLLMSSRPGISLTKACLGLVFITIVDGFGYVKKKKKKTSNFCIFFCYDADRWLLIVEFSERRVIIFTLLIYRRFGYVHMLLDMQVSWVGSRRKRLLIVNKVIHRSKLTCVQEPF